MILAPGALVLLVGPPAAGKSTLAVSLVAAGEVHPDDVLSTDTYREVPTGDALDIVISHAQAHADFPQPGGCPALAGTVSGNATLVNEQADPSQLPVVVGFVSIPPQGGHDHQDLDQLSTSFVNSGTLVSDTAGAVLASSEGLTRVGLRRRRPRASTGPA